MKVFTVFGTRPEAIKMCPLVLKLKENKDIECVVCLTGQHKEMLEQVMTAFGVREDYNLEIMKDRQTLTTITTSILEKIEPVLKQEKPDIVLVHGDTTTSYAAALAAFYQQIPVGHVEAGLRTGDIYSPFPEEMNRLLTDRISTYYYAPTELNRANLLSEGITDNIFVTGNTVIDALLYGIEKVKSDSSIVADLKLRLLSNKEIVLITCHRRENHGNGILNVCKAVKELALSNENYQFVFPVHLNPKILKIVHEELISIENIVLIEPLNYPNFIWLMNESKIIVTDSGGVQEEAPSLGKPVIVVRDETERPEAVEAGTVKLVGSNVDLIVKNVQALIDDKNLYEKMSNAHNPYGDGKAVERIIEVIKNYN